MIFKIVWEPWIFQHKNMCKLLDFSHPLKQMMLNACFLPITILIEFCFVFPRARPHEITYLITTFNDLFKNDLYVLFNDAYLYPTF